MSEFEAPEADSLEQHRDLVEPPEEPADASLEVPEADVVEQQTPAEGPAGPGGHGQLLEVDEADRAEQERTVDYDEDEYR